MPRTQERLPSEEERFDRYMLARTNDGRPVQLYHQCDPSAPRPCNVWHYVYLHGVAEQRNEVEAERYNYWSDKPADDDTRPWAASDLFVCDTPMPWEGDYQAFLYDHPVLVVIAHSGLGNIRHGRAACLDDPEGFAHACRPEEWR